jgi:hypothetical protein
MQRWIAGATSALMVASILLWLVVVLGGLSELSHTPEQAGCYLPNTRSGIGFLALAAVGLLVATWTLVASVAVARGKRADWMFTAGLATTVALFGMVVGVALTFGRDDDFGPCPSP